MSRLIDADALKETVKNERFSGWGNCCVEIDDAPTVDAVQVVRCKDCKHYDTKDCADGFGWCNRNGTGHGSTDDWYCADGGRRNDE